MTAPHVRRALRVLVPTALLLGGALARADEPSPAPPPRPPSGGPAAPPPSSPNPAPPPPAPPPRPAPVVRPEASADEIDLARLKAHIAALTAKELAGRGTPDDREKAALYVARALEGAGVKPVTGATSLLRAFPAAIGFPAGTNVVGVVPGTRSDEHVVISAHFDHLLPKKETWFPGADDNASGVAALVEIARALAAGPAPGRTVVVVAFDLEENGLVGSRRYVESPPLPLDACAAFTTMDMMGRSIADVSPGLLLVMGGERADALSGLTASFPAAKGVVVRELGMDFNQLGWSDYVPFEEKRVPSLFFTSGACRDYHQPTDTADKIDLPSLRARAATVLAAVRALAAAPARPVWKDVAAPRLVEIESLLALVKDAGAKEEELHLTPAMRAMRKSFEERLGQTIAKGTVTVGERVGIRTLALMMFQAATRAR